MSTIDIDVPTRSDRARRFLARCQKNRNVVLGACILTPVVALVVLSPLLPIQDPSATNVADAYASPSAEYPFGTDNYGRDLLSRTLLGGQVSLFLGVASVLIGLGVGVPLGLISGYFGGRTDEFLMRLTDVLLSFPSLLLALLIIVALGSSLMNAILAIGIVFIPRIARVVRGATLSVKNEAYIEAARARGESNWYIIFAIILPNVLSPIVVEGSIRIGYAILIGTSISFLGLGTQPPHPDWGYMISESRHVLYHTPWFLFWPSVFLAITVTGFNLLGDGLRDVLDPRTSN